MKAPARHALMGLIVTLSSLPVAAAASAPISTEGCPSARETQIVKPKKGPRARPAVAPDQNLFWHLHHI